MFAETFWNSWFLRRGVVCLGMMASLAGCGNSADRYIPSVDRAKEVLTTCLDDWKRGLPAGPVSNTNSTVFVVDSQRRDRPVLADYEILGEVPGNAPRCLAVRLRWADPAKEERTRYVVVGIDPLWIFRQEDYDLLSHWEHPMEESVPAAEKSVEQGAVN